MSHLMIGQSAGSLDARVGFMNVPNTNDPVLAVWFLSEPGGRLLIDPPHTHCIIRVGSNHKAVEFSAEVQNVSSVHLHMPRCESLITDYTFFPSDLELHTPQLGEGYLDLIAKTYDYAMNTEMWNWGWYATWGFLNRPLLPGLSVYLEIEGEPVEFPLYDASPCWPSWAGRPKPIFYNADLSLYLWWAGDIFVATEDHPNSIGGVPPTDHLQYDPQTGMLVGYGQHEGSSYPLTGNITGEDAPIFQLAALVCLGLTYFDLW